MNRILETSIAFWRSAALFAALRLNLFQKLGEKPSTYKDVADLLKVDPDYIRRLLRVLTAMGLLKRQDDRYLCSTELLDNLIPGRERNLSHFSRLMGEDFANGIWGRVPGVNGNLPLQVVEEGPMRRELFTLAMQNLAQIGEAEALQDNLDLSERSNLLDLGGGSGAYAIALCKRFRNLTALVVDLPEVVPMTKKIVAENEIDDRIGVLGIDWHEADFTDEFDAVLLSDILYKNAGENRKLIQFAGDSLTEGGIIILRGYFLDDNDNRLFPALFDMNLMMHSRDNSNPSVKMVDDWLKEAGFSEVESRPLTEISYLITATKTKVDDD